MALGAGAIRLASEEEFASVFPDCEIGAEPPFGSIYGVPTIVDEGLQSEEITFNSGNHQEVITMALADYVESVEPFRGKLAATP
jgi:Ala-tRNA(Pro) deacylase